MASTYSDQLRLEKQADGENENTWGQIVNTQFELIEEAIAGKLDLVAAGTDITLVMSDGASHATLSARNMFLSVTGTLTANVAIVVPATAKMYVVQNATSGAFSLSVKTSGGVAAVVPQDEIQIVVCDGTDCALVNGDPTEIAEATNSLQLGGVVAANYARKDQGAPSDQVFTKAQAVARSTLSISTGNVAVDASLSNAFRLVLTSNATLLTPTNPYDGQVIRIVVKQDGTGGRTLAYGSAYKFPGGTAPVLSTGANAIDYLAFEYSGADSVWIGNILKDLR
jgi:hypothetical protein